jgi:hypothetical protein
MRAADMAILGLVFFLGLIAIVLYAKRKELFDAPESEPYLTRSDFEKPAPQPPPEPTLEERIGEASSMQEALNISRPLMSDTIDAVSFGESLFTIWAMKHLKWSDVHVAKEETSIKLVRKDPESERGKRMCHSGTILQITKADAGHLGATFVGLLVTRSDDILHFTAIGSTGELVEDSRARFCGVVIGRSSYSNTGGGTTHAVKLVGMFKLPENEQP